MKTSKPAYINDFWQITSLTTLRILIGWHFLYEGLSKLYADPAWSSKAYLASAVGPFKGMFHRLAASDALLPVADIMNVWGLVLIGLSLIIGFFDKLAGYFAMLMLAFYYFAYPPFTQYVMNAPVEGNYWIVNKILIELIAIWVLVQFPTGKVTGLNALFPKLRD